MPENTNSKSWWRSKTIWGLIITGVSIVAPKYQPIAQALPSLLDQFATAFGLALGLYGRLKTDTRVNSPIAPK